MNYLKELENLDIDDVGDFPDATSFFNKIDAKKEQPKINVYREIKTDITDLDISSKGDLEKIVKELLVIENELDELANLSKIRRKVKTSLRTKVMEYMIFNNIDDLALPDGGLFAVNTKMKKVNPLTKKRLPLYVYKYFHEHKKNNESDAEKARNEMMEYIIKNAEEVQQSSIKRIKPIK